MGCLATFQEEESFHWQLFSFGKHHLDGDGREKTPIHGGKVKALQSYSAGADLAIEHFKK